MIELKFGTEGVTHCPKDEMATRKECFDCKYYKPIDWRKSQFRTSCIYEDVFPEPTEPLLEVNPFEIGLETLSDAEWNKDNWIMEQARIDLVETVIKSLDKEDRKRLQLFQERNNPCKEVE